MARLRLAAQLCADIVTSATQAKALVRTLRARLIVAHHFSFRHKQVKIELGSFQTFKADVDARLKQAEKENDVRW